MRPRGPSSSSPEQLVGRARRGAEAAMHARAQDARRLRGLRACRGIRGRDWSATGQMPVHETAAIEDALRIEHGLQASMQREHGRVERMERVDRLVRRRETAWRDRPARRTTCAAVAGSTRSLAASQRKPPPHSISWSPPRSVCGAVGRTDKPPQRLARSRGVDEKAMRVVAHARPERVAVVRDAAPPSFAQRRVAPRAARRTAARDSTSVVKARRGHRQRLAAPLVDARGSPRRPSIRSVIVASARGIGRHLSETSVITPSVPSAPVMRRETSKPATFFMTRPPNVELLARAVDDLDAEHEVAHGAGIRPARSRQAARDRAAERCRPAPKCGGSKREHLPARLHRAFDRGERRAGARGDDELGRLVVDDAGVHAACRATSPSSAPP